MDNTWMCVGSLCKICGFSGGCGPYSLKSHIKREHNLSPQEYYDKYFKKGIEGFCKFCMKPTPFKKYGYLEFCNHSCAGNFHSAKYSELILERWKSKQFQKAVSQGVSKRMKKEWENPKRLIKQRKIVAKMNENPEYQEQNRQRAKKMIADPDINFGKGNSWVLSPIERHKKQAQVMKKINSSSENRERALRRLKDPNDMFGKVYQVCYSGITMKSSWEGIFAELCDKYKIVWEYEPKSFIVDHKDRYSYTPDFYLPYYNLWIEVKPAVFIEKYRSLMERFTEMTGNVIQIISLEDFELFFKKLIS